MRRPSLRGTSTFMCRETIWDATRAPASRHTSAAALSNAALCVPRTPAVGHAARWSHDTDRSRWARAEGVSERLLAVEQPEESVALSHLSRICGSPRVFLALVASFSVWWAACLGCPHKTHWPSKAQR